MAYVVRLEIFEGPLDLLMHLIEKNQVDIYDIPIAQITAQYLEYLETLEKLDLEVASEFLVMAARLLAIKAAMLLPRPTRPEGEAGEEMEEEDPRQELVRRLLEYKKFKEAAHYLQRLHREEERYWARSNSREMYEPFFQEENPLAGVSLFSLVDALRQVLQRIVDEGRTEEEITLVRDEVTVRDKMREIMARLFLRPEGLCFTDLFGGQTRRSEVVVTFLALLELIKMGRVRAYQEGIFAPIILYARMEKVRREG
ncbi:MAG: segregation and condensation protein [Eubacteriales bacterium]|nr:segregation and condensation protein [Eubacteriales bacterium]MDN5364050.1 segregation and condensation protein [Eubacteriales bacterium]